MSWLDDYNEASAAGDPNSFFAPGDRKRGGAPSTSKKSWLDYYNEASAAGDPNSFFAPGDLSFFTPDNKGSGSPAAENVPTYNPGGGAYDDLMQPTGPMTQLGMTPDEMMQYLLGGSSGGGGVDLSGYNALLEDIAARESALGGRRDENLAGIQSLYESAAAAREEDQAALEASIEAQIQSDMERQAAQEASRRASEGERFETASEARQALGADVGTSDLVGQTVEQSLGRLAERALAGQQDIGTTGELARQQLQAEKSGYTSAQELATRALTNAYEDRLAQLASERAATQAQIAQARASARPSGPSISDKINAMGFIQSLYGGDEEQAELPGLEGVFQQYDDIYQGSPIAAEITKNFPVIANAVYGVQPETGDLLNPTQLTAAIIEANPQYSPYSSLILQLAQESGI